MPETYDLVVYGATVAGVAAAIAGARAGKRILLIQTGSHFGGMTTGGLCHVDKGDESTIGGIAGSSILAWDSRTADPQRGPCSRRSRSGSSARC